MGTSTERIAMSRLRECVSVLAAIAIGPAILHIGHALYGHSFMGPAYSLILCWSVAVPVMVFAAGPMKFLTWQLAVLSITITLVGDNIRSKGLHGSGIV